MILSIQHYKKRNEGFKSFKNAFLVSYLSGVIMAVCDLIASIILVFIFTTVLGDFNFIRNILAAMLEVVASSFVGLFNLFLGCIFGVIVAALISLTIRSERLVGFNVD